MKQRKKIVLKFLSTLSIVLLLISNTMAFATTEIDSYAVVPDSCPIDGYHRAVLIRYEQGYWNNLGPSNRMTRLYQCLCGAKIVCTGHPSAAGGIVGDYSTAFTQHNKGDIRFTIYSSVYSSSNRLFDWIFY